MQQCCSRLGACVTAMHLRLLKTGKGIFECRIIASCDWDLQETERRTDSRVNVNVFVPALYSTGAYARLPGNMHPPTNTSAFTTSKTTILKVFSLRSCVCGIMTAIKWA